MLRRLANCPQALGRLWKYLSWGWGALKQPARAGTIDSPNFVVSIVVFILPVLGYSWVIKRAAARGAVATAEGPHGEGRFAGDSGAR